MNRYFRADFAKRILSLLLLTAMLFPGLYSERGTAFASVPCVWCGGDGEVTCSNCGGTGAAFGSVVGSCYKCMGSGYTTCGFCGGTGYLGSNPGNWDDGGGGNGGGGGSGPAISLSSTSLSLTVGHTETLTLNNASGTVTWSSSNTKVATVSSKGVVNPKKKGSATITAAHKGKNYKCKVKVHNAVYASKITVSPRKLTLLPDKEYQMAYKVYPAAAKITEDYTVTWKSSKKSVATVDKNGEIRTRSAGSTVITATMKSKGKAAKKSTCKVVVQNARSMLVNFLAKYNYSHVDGEGTVSYDPARNTFQLKRENDHEWMTITFPAFLSGTAEIEYFYTSPYGTSLRVECSTKVNMKDVNHHGSYNWTFLTDDHYPSMPNTMVDVVLSGFHCMAVKEFGGTVRDFGFKNYY